MNNYAFPALAAGLIMMLPLGNVSAAPVPPPGRPKEIASFQAHRFDIRCLAFSPDGKTLASGGSDGVVKLWDVATDKNIADFQAHFPNERAFRGRVDGITFSPDGKTLASCGNDRTVRLWNVATCGNLAAIERISGGSLTFSPDGKTLICGYSQLDLATKKAQPLVENTTGGWPVVRFNPEGKLLVGMSFISPASFAVWDGKTGKKILTCKGKHKRFTCDAFSPDGKTVVSSEWDHETQRWVIRLWDIASGKNTASFEQKDLPGYPIFSPDGKILIFSCRPFPDRDSPSSLRILEVSSGKVLANLNGYKRRIGSLVLSRDGRLLAGEEANGIIKIWRLPVRYKTD